MPEKSASPSDLAGAMRAKGLHGVLVQMAEWGQLLEFACEMPQCYCPKGRRHFDERTPNEGDWEPNLDHYPVPEMAGEANPGQRPIGPRHV